MLCGVSFVFFLFGQMSYANDVTEKRKQLEIEKEDTPELLQRYMVSFSDALFCSLFVVALFSPYTLVHLLTRSLVFYFPITTLWFKLVEWPEQLRPVTSVRLGAACCRVQI